MVNLLFMPLHFMPSPSKNIAWLPCLSLSLSNTRSRPALCPSVVQFGSKMYLLQPRQDPSRGHTGQHACSQLFLDPGTILGTESCPRGLRLSVCKTSQTHRNITGRYACCRRASWSYGEVGAASVRLLHHSY